MAGESVRKPAFVEDLDQPAGGEGVTQSLTDDIDDDCP
jgi:hypothetical protein